MQTNKLLREDFIKIYGEDAKTEEIYKNLETLIKGRQPDMKIGYVDLFNSTVKVLKYLTFPYYRTASHKHRANLPSYQAVTANLFVECDFDYVLIVQGLEGIGKSSYCLRMIDDLRSLGKEFDKSKHMITKSWEYKDVENLISESRNSVIFFDEGKKFFDLRRSMHPERVDMLEFFTTERWRRNIYILAVSDLSEIDKYFRERRAKAITLLPDRGLAYMLHSVNLFGVGQDRFFLERFEQMISSDKNAMNFQRQLSMLMSLPTCYGLGEVSKLEGKEWNEYFELKIKRPEPKQKVEPKSRKLEDFE